MALVSRQQRVTSSDTSSTDSTFDEEIASAKESSEPHVFHGDVREGLCLQGFHELFKAGELFDVELFVDGRVFSCHRALLAASSDYFRAMFTNDLAERDQNRVAINGVSATSMELVIGYLYSGEVIIRPDTVQNLLSAANLLRLNDLCEGCATYMGKKLDVENCVGIHFFAQAHGCGQLEADAKEIMLESFDDVADNAEFLEMSVDQLLEILTFEEIIAGEEEIFKAVVKWVQHDPDQRAPSVPTLMSLIRFALFDEYFLFDEVKEHPLLRKDHVVQAMLEEVVRYKLLKGRWMEWDFRLEPRKGADFCRAVVYSGYLDDDKKQVVQLYGPGTEHLNLHGNVGLCDLPTDMENPALLVTGDNDLYVAGGDGCGKCFYKWIDEDDTFDDMTSLPRSMKQFCLVQVDKSIYVLGGRGDKGNLSNVLRYCEESDDWVEQAPMPKALRCFCCVSFRGKLYVFGGEAERTVKKSAAGGKKELNKQTFCYDPRQDKWSRLADMGVPRALAGCTILGNKIYVIGGFVTIGESWLKDNSPENCQRTVEIYDPLTDTWEAGVDLPKPLCAMGVVKYYGTIYVLGGETENEASCSVYALNAARTEWEMMEDLIPGVTETTIHSNYAVLNAEV